MSLQAINPATGTVVGTYDETSIDRVSAIVERASAARQ